MRGCGRETRAYLVEMLTENIPNPRPLKPNTTHVVIGDFDNFRQAILSRRIRLQLVLAHVAQPLDKLNNRIAVEFHRSREDTIDSNDDALHVLANLHLNIGQRFRVQHVLMMMMTRSAAASTTAQLIDYIRAHVIHERHRCDR